MFVPIFPGANDVANAFATRYAAMVRAADCSDILNNSFHDVVGCPW